MHAYLGVFVKPCLSSFSKRTSWHLESEGTNAAITSTTYHNVGSRIEENNLKLGSTKKRMAFTVKERNTLASIALIFTINTLFSQIRKLFFHRIGIIRFVQPLCCIPSPPLPSLFRSKQRNVLLIFNGKKKVPTVKNVYLKHTHIHHNI